MHVSILSVMSFCGRLCSGISMLSVLLRPESNLSTYIGVGSDLIVRKLHMSRFWCLFISSSLFCAAQICGGRIENPHYLGFVSGLTGCKSSSRYFKWSCSDGDCSGLRLPLRCLPSHCRRDFWRSWSLPKLGLYDSCAHHFWQHLQFTLRYVILAYSQHYGKNTIDVRHPGSIYDHHSMILPGGHRECPDGLQCYSAAYWVTFGASLAGVGVSLWSVRHDHVVKAKMRNARDHTRTA